MGRRRKTAKDDISVNAADAERSYCQADARGQDLDDPEKIEALSMLRKGGSAFHEMILQKRDVRSAFQITKSLYWPGCMMFAFSMPLIAKKSGAGYAPKTS